MLELNQQQVDRAVVLYAAGLKPSDISQMTGISVKKLYRIQGRFVDDITEMAAKLHARDMDTMRRAVDAGLKISQLVDSIK